jgi:hypothetical protein
MVCEVGFSPPIYMPGVPILRAVWLSLVAVVFVAFETHLGCYMAAPRTAASVGFIHLRTKKLLALKHSETTNDPAPP